MRFLTIFFLAIFLLPIETGQAKNADWQESRAVAEIFTNAQVNGTFVLFDVEQNKFIGFNYARAAKRYAPASTFKIPNTLIGLATGAIQDVDEQLLYTGKPVATTMNWPSSSSLREAMKVSNLPIYQTLALRIGLDSMREQLAKLNYGNNEVGELVDSFWINGTLQISALEQAQFLARLAQQQLPVEKKYQEEVKEIILYEEHAGWKLYAKTGAAVIHQPDLGWWVGWVESEGRIYTFALNIDMPDFDSYLAKRIQLGRSSLLALGVISYDRSTF